MKVNDLLNQNVGTVVEDTMGLVTFVGDVKSGVRGSRQWSNQFTYFKDQVGSSIAVIFWNRPEVKDLKGKIVSVKSTKSGDIKIGEYNGKLQLNVAESASVTIYEGGKQTRGVQKSEVKSERPSSSFTSKRMGTPAAAYGAAFQWATFLVYRELTKHFGNMKSVPECYGAMVNTLMIAYGNGQLVPDAAIEAHIDDTPKLKEPEAEAAPKNEGQGEAPPAEAPVDPAPGVKSDDDIPF